MSSKWPIPGTSIIPRSIAVLQAIGEPSGTPHLRTKVIAGKNRERFWDWGKRSVLIPRLPSLPIFSMLRAEIREIVIQNGKVVIALDSKREFVPVKSVDFTITNPFLHIPAVPAEVVVRGEIPSDPPGQISSHMVFQSYSPSFNLEGELDIRNVFTPYFYNIMAAGGVDVNAGILAVQSTVRCVDSWLTMSNVVSIDQLDVTTEEKKLFGIPSDTVTAFFRDNVVSFSLPISGDIHNKI